MDDLPARAAGQGGLAGGRVDRHRHDFPLALGHCRENRGALGAVRHSVRGVFHVAAGEDAAVIRQQRRADLEAGIGRVGVLRGFTRSGDKRGRIDFFCGFAWFF